MQTGAVENISSFAHRAVNQNKYQGLCTLANLRGNPQRFLLCDGRVSVSLIVAIAEGEDVSQWATRGVAAGDADLSEDSIQLRQLFRELKPKNQKVAVGLLRALNRTQSGK